MGTETVMHGDSQLLHVGDLSPKVDDKLVPSPAPRVRSPKDAEYWHLRGLEKHYKHREHWSWFLLSLISAMVLFQMVVIVLAGIDIPAESTTPTYGWRGLRDNRRARPIG